MTSHRSVPLSDDWILLYAQRDVETTWRLHLPWATWWAVRRRVTMRHISVNIPVQYSMCAWIFRTRLVNVLWCKRRILLSKARPVCRTQLLDTHFSLALPSIPSASNAAKPLPGRFAGCLGQGYAGRLRHVNNLLRRVDEVIVLSKIELSYTRISHDSRRNR